ncbi:MAG: SDR family NAD(P)-dependent oxidoreductase [Promethearchaeota archaeon]
MELSGEKVLITGAGGFIGSHLVEVLLKKGCNVRAFIKYSSSGNIGNLKWLKNNTNNLTVIYGDVRDYDSVFQAMKGCSIVFHLAALISIPYSYSNPVGFFKTNVLGTLNVLETARKLRIERILHTSTSEVYGTAQYVPMDEKHPTIAQSPYSASKIAADKASESYFLSYNVPVVIVRPFNTFGPRQSTRAFIPSVIVQALTKDEIKMGDLTPTRDLTYVIDTVEGFIALAIAEEDVLGKTFNLGTGQEHIVGDVAKKILSLTNPKGRIVTESSRIRPKKSEVRRLCSNPEKIWKYTNWKCKYSFDEGIEKTIHWFKNNKQILAEFYSNLI